MLTKSIRSLTLTYDAEEAGAAQLIGRACERSLDLIRDLWALEVPAGCRVYVMTSWQRFLFHSAPWPWRIYLALTLPLRYGRIRQLWRLSGGWAQRYGTRQIIGLKPPHLLENVDAGLRERIFYPREVEEWVQHNTCHELVHACSEHLRLPSWLHEGLAMVTVDRYAAKPTVKQDTLKALDRPAAGPLPRERVGSLTTDPDNLLVLAVRGYWLTRYLEEEYPALLASLLTRQQPVEALEDALAAGLGMTREEYGQKIDGIVVSHFDSAPGGNR